MLYEMLTGARAFDGEDVTEMMAAVVKTTPNWTALPAEVPPQVVTLIQRSLEKDRSARIGDIAVARFLLSDHATLVASPTTVAHPADAAEPQARPSRIGRVAMTFALVLAIAAVAAGVRACADGEPRCTFPRSVSKSPRRQPMIRR